MKALAALTGKEHHRADPAWREGADPRSEVDDSAYDLVSVEVNRSSFWAGYSECIIGPFGLTPFPKEHSHKQSKPLIRERIKVKLCGGERESSDARVSLRGRGVESGKAERFF